MANTTVQISNDLLERLKSIKINEKESYEELIWNLIEDTTELSEETKKEIAEARAEIKAGKFHTLAQVKKELNLNV